MNKPDWCPQDVWDGADIVGERIHGRHVRGWVVWPLITEDGKPAQEIIARAILAAEKRGEEREREACAVVAQGEDYHTHYRTWPWWKMPDGCGNRSNESDLVRHADSIAAAIRARSTP